MTSSTQRFKNCFHRIVEIESGYPRHTIQCLYSNGGFWAKSMRNTDQRGRLKTICPEI